MATDRFMIAPFDQNSGQQTNLRPWLIPDQAFEELIDAYVFRGRVRKRFGTRYIGDDSLVSRLRINIGTTDGSGNFTGSVPVSAPNTPIITPAVGQMFSVDTQVFTVNVLGNPATMLISETATLATFDTTTGAVVINGAAAGSVVFYYPALPVMGLLTYQQNAINDERYIAFDTRFAYEYSSGWNRLAGEITPGAATWTGSDSQFFWGTTWTGTNAFDKVFFVTNFNENEPNFMRSFFNNLWDNFRPQIDATPNYLNSARILVPFKNRLVAFNTWEGPNSPLPGDNYVNRARYCQIGSPLDTNAWRQDIPGRGNAIDAPTTEAIVTVEFVRDRLIVFFESSTWEFVYTGNQAYPFAWQQINTELGVESTFSIVPFDKIALGVGNVGIMACSGTVVERIDDKIPDTVFSIHNVSGGIFRVYGVRDYTIEMVYWTFPDEEDNDDFPYPNRILVYNYKTGTWAFFKDSITVFGQFQPIVVDNTTSWDSNVVTWDDDDSWSGTAIQAKFRQVIAGNQEGYTFVCDPEHTRTAGLLQITDITSALSRTQLNIINHNLRDGDYIYITDVVWDDASDILNHQIFQVDVIDRNNINIIPNVSFTGVYKGGGLISRVPQIDILTKQYNFYAKQGRNAYVSKVDFMVDATAPEAQSALDVDFYVSTSVTPLLQISAANGSLLGTGALETFPYPTVPFEADATRLWHPVYFQADGEIVQFEIMMNDAQLRTVIQVVNDQGIISYTGPTFVDFQLHTMIIHTTPTSSRLQ